MNVWYHLSTIFSQRRTLRIAGLLTLCVALITTLFLHNAANAAPGVNQTMSFQGRLLNSQGNVVPDGYYNIQYKIYQDGPGNVAGNTGGTLKWTETYINNGGNNGVSVKNGYFSVTLGSKTPFGNSIDWNQDTLWLSMNVAGASAGCLTFGTAPCAADGEMLPMKRLTSTPYALNAGKLGGIDASGFIQNTLTQQTGNFNISGTGKANLLQGVSGIEAPLLDRSDSGTLAIGSTNATTIDIGSSTGNQTINIGTGPGDKTLAIGNTDGESLLALRGGSSGVQVESSGDFTVHSTETDRDTLVIGSAGNATINLSNETGFVINNGNDESVFQVGDDGSIETSSTSALAIKGTATFGKGIQIGNGVDDGAPSLLTLDRATEAPEGENEALLGSMYYDTTLGKVQCYEADGWGSCSDSPDTFVTLSPEYSNAVMNGSGNGQMTSDVCSDELNINDGSEVNNVAQPEVCGENETYNFYKWTSDQTSGAQTKSIFVTYQLPDNFKEIVEGSMSLMARTDSPNSTVSYQVYKNSSTGLQACSATPTVASSGIKTTWQKSVGDSSNCTFEGGDSIVIKIIMSASHDASAYVSTLNFAYSNK